jgi:hypothetical protein
MSQSRAPWRKQARCNGWWRHFPKNHQDSALPVRNAGSPLQKGPIVSPRLMVLLLLLLLMGGKAWHEKDLERGKGKLNRNVERTKRDEKGTYRKKDNWKYETKRLLATMLSGVTGAHMHKATPDHVVVWMRTLPVPSFHPYRHQHLDIL